MARRVRDFRTEEELSDFVNSIAWSESEDGDDFSADGSDYDPDFDFEAALRSRNTEESEQVGDSDGENESLEIADGQNNAAAYVDMGNSNIETNHGKVLPLPRKLLFVSK